MPTQLAQSGSVNIGAGVDVVSVSGLGLTFTPTGFSGTVRKSGGGDLNLVAYPIGIPTADGFSFELSAATDSASYVLDWTAWSDGTQIDNSTTLALTYADLCASVRRFLGYPETMTAGQVAEVDGYVQSGVRQFYYPPAVPGVEPGYAWGFLNPTAQLVTVAGESVIALPASLGRVVGDLTFAPSVFSQSIVLVSEARMQALLQRSTDRSRPRFATVRFKQAVGAHGQTQELVLWPVPDAAYTLTYRYEAYNGKLSALNPVPLGGMRFAELILESCLSIAEQRANDERGLHTERFAALLAAGIAQDRRAGARFYGHMGGSGEDVEPSARGLRQTSYDITYKGSTW